MNVKIDRLSVCVTVGTVSTSKHLEVRCGVCVRVCVVRYNNV